MLKTPRLLLRKFRADDLTNVYQGLSHPEVIKYYGVSFDSLKATQEQMDWFSNLERTNTGQWWAVCAADTGAFYGAGGLNEMDLNHKKAEIGFWLLPQYWGRGIMTEAMSLICRYAFETIGLHRIEGFVETGNHNCKRAMQKLNFHHEGTMRDCEIKNGSFISLDIYAKLKFEI